MLHWDAGTATARDCCAADLWDGRAAVARGSGTDLTCSDL